MDKAEKPSRARAVIVYTQLFSYKDPSLTVEQCKAVMGWASPAAMRISFS